jgi:DNA-binding transcriptional LysR family regulator
MGRVSALQVPIDRAAAEASYKAQPNLSVQAKRFQENASVRLYRRTKSGRIRITEQGRAFLNMAHLLLGTRDEILEALSELEHSESAGNNGILRRATLMGPFKTLRYRLGREAGRRQSELPRILRRDLLMHATPHPQEPFQMTPTEAA